MSTLAQIAEEFAEQKVLSTKAEGIDTDLLSVLWKNNALEVLAFAVPRLIPGYGEHEAPVPE